MKNNPKTSVVVCTFNDEDKIARCIESLSFADEIVIVDDGSTDKTIDVASKYTKNVFKHKSVGYVEPARNFAISKATGDWILVIDSDEVVGKELAKELIEFSKKADISYVEIPRKNIIFGKWMRASMWWPDYNIRFFRKNTVVWSDMIHSNPQTSGLGSKLEPTENNAIVHHNYSSIAQFVERNSRYSKIQAAELHKKGIKFEWMDLIRKSLGEFLGRFFANKGYQDGMHGLALSLLQSFMFLLQYLYLWEISGFKDEKFALKEVKKESTAAGKQIKYWFNFSELSGNPIKRELQKIKNKLIK